MRRRWLPSGSYKVRAIPLDNLKSGTPYYSVDCPACGKLVPLFTQPDNALKETKIEGPGHLLAACQYCGAIRLYAPDALKLVPWA
jgi:hypothetical protein